MIKFNVVGDVHTDWDGMWGALRAASCATTDGLPTPPVKSGMYQVVLMGDLVHPKNVSEYEKLTGLSPFDERDPEHLIIAAREQVRHLEKIKRYQEAAPHSVHILLGNHDDAVIEPRFLLGTSSGLKHMEFDPEHGGVPLPDHLKDWMRTFPREIRVGGVQFAHVSPMPAHCYYDDLFYSDHSTKRWFREAPEYVQMAGLSFGVYGHTQIDGGILINEEHRFAVVDSLVNREYLELLVDVKQTDPVVAVRAIPF